MRHYDEFSRVCREQEAEIRKEAADLVKNRGIAPWVALAMAADNLRKNYQPEQPAKKA